MNKLNDIFEHTDCIPQEMLAKYLSDTLSAAEKHRIEKHLTDCEMCADAMEGLSLLAPGKISSLVSELNLLIQQKSQRKKETKIIFLKQYRTEFAIAASIILILGFVWLLREIVLTKELNPTEAEQLFTEKFEPPPAEIDEEIQNTFHSSTEQNEEDEKNMALGEEPTQIAVNEKKVARINTSENKFVVPQANVAIMQKAANVPIEEQQIVSYSNSPNPEIIKKTETVSSEGSGSESFHADKPEALAEKNTLKKPVDPRIEKDEDGTNRKYSEMQTGRYSFEQKTKEYSGKKKSKTQQKISDNYSDYKTTLRVSNTDNTKETRNSLKPDSAGTSLSMITIMTSVKATDADSAMKKYEHKDYAGAAAFFEKVIQQNPSDERALFYAGVSYLSIGHSDKAIAYFNKILINKNSKYYDDAQWYSSLAYIKNNNLKNARSNLIQLRDNKRSRYRKQADEVLQQIK